ncbi:hypothetical protein BDW75DRAFT_231686 [Aspergillus navahoensis]
MTEQGNASSTKRSIELRCVGHWGQADFHRILSWLTQEFCDRAGRTAVLSLRDGGLDSPLQVHNGQAELGICTPAGMLKAATAGKEIFASTGPMPDLRGLAVLPQRDRMMFAVNPSLGGSRTEESAVQWWGGSWVKACRPEQVLALTETGQADAVIQEAIMTPWWRNLIESRALVPVPREEGPMEYLAPRVGFNPSVIRANFWNTTRETVEAQYTHFPPERRPLSYPLDLVKMAQSNLPLHPAAEQFYREEGYLN